MESVWSVSKLSTESVGSRRELVANSVYTADVTQLDSTDESRRRRRCVLGISCATCNECATTAAISCGDSCALYSARKSSMS